jgi:isocitrate dehydrogenase kinase/phosphatase
MTDASTAYAVAECILSAVSTFHRRFAEITHRARDRFLGRDWQGMRSDALERLELYGDSVDRTVTLLRDRFGEVVDDRDVWVSARSRYAGWITGRPTRELDETFFNSMTRRILVTVGVDAAVEFVDDGRGAEGEEDPGGFRTFPVQGDIRQALQAVAAGTGLSLADESLRPALERVAGKVRRRLGGDSARLLRIETLEGLFYRGQGAYLIGRLVREGAPPLPMVLAFRHPPEGVALDAVLLDEDSVSILFSFTRSAFHVICPHPGATVGFLRTLLPHKLVGELYSAIGHFKHAKTELYRDLLAYTESCGEDRFSEAPGAPGMVMIVFAMPHHDLVIKLIRDRFQRPKTTTRRQVIDQYAYVFKHYRAGRLVEAQEFEFLSIDRCWFAEDLLETLLKEAGRTVRLSGTDVVIRHAYVERRVTPLDLYLQNAAEAEAAAAVADFGEAIRDLAVSNIFPGDLLLKNFGVTRHGRVVFYDYDELCPLTDCRFRSLPQARSDYEEMADEPWFHVQDNDVFPEEFTPFLGLQDRRKEMLLQQHGDLFRPAFWIEAQQSVRSGTMREVPPYRQADRLFPDRPLQDETPRPTERRDS